MSEDLTSTEFCPRCGTPRDAEFAFCRHCGLDFRALPGLGSSGPTPSHSLIAVDGADRSQALPLGAALVLVSAALVLLGTFLPWWAVGVPGLGTVFTNGLDGGGADLTVAAGILLAIAGVGLWAQPREPGWRGLALMVGLGTSLLVLLAVTTVQADISQITTSSAGHISSWVGPGMVAIGAGGTLGTLAAMFAPSGVG